MSEQPAQYGDHPVSPSITTRVDALERITEQNASAIAGLINSVDRMRASFDSRLTAIESQLAALNESNRLLVELLTSRLPAPPKENL